jgi:hypothetical protein
MRKIFKIDFDGTIVKEEWPNVGPPIDGAIEALKEIKQLGHILILDTCRHDHLLEEAKSFLISNGIEFDFYNENPPWLIEQYGDCRKITCDFDVDDKNITPWTWMDVLEIARRLAWEQ